MFLPQKYISGQESHEKMFKITSYKGNASQNKNEIPPNIHQKGYYEKTPETNKYLKGCEEK